MVGSTRYGLLVVGGGAAGKAAVGAYRRHGGTGPVALASAEAELPYNRPPLSKDFLRGDTGEDALPLAPPEWYAGVDLLLGNALVHLSPGERSARFADGTEIDYDSCVLALGSEPVPLPVPGGDDPRVYLLRSLESARRLRAAVEQADSVVVLGSGFIGCEAALSLARRGLRVTVISNEPLPQQRRLGDWAAQRIADWCAEAGVQLISGAEVQGVEEGRRVHVAGHAPFDADLVLTGGGVRPRVDVAQQAGIPVRDGRVPVDAQLRAEAPGLFVAGDLALAHNGCAGRRLPVEHWGEAERMGEVAGTVAAGGDDAWAQVPGFWTQLGDRTLKYAAWGDGFGEARVDEDGPERFTVWYSRDGGCVGALTYQADDDYDLAAKLTAQAAPLPDR
jgi:3-phenylpropionate/trans-cinnamate dioxygenase ferredoxin reductase component